MNRLLSMRTAITGVLIVALGLLIWQAASEGLANIYTQSAQQELDRWQTSRIEVSTVDSDRVLQTLAAILKPTFCLTIQKLRQCQPASRMRHQVGIVTVLCQRSGQAVTK